MKKITLILLFIPFFVIAQWTQTGNFIGENNSDRLGEAVSINKKGNIIAIGIPYEDTSATSAGQVKIFENIDGVWTQLGNNINGLNSSDKFGISVALNEEGNIVAVGALDSNANGYESGQVRVFELVGGSWQQLGENIDGEALSDHSGEAISINNQGNIIAIGAKHNEATDGGNFGHVRVYQFIDDQWEQLGNDIDGDNAQDLFGNSVSLNGEGTLLAIGAPYNDDNGVSSGKVKVFEYQTDNWEQIGDDILGKTNQDRFGESVSLNANGTILAVGATLGGENPTGTVSVLQRDGNNWVQIGDDINGEENNDFFGISVALNSEGNVLIVGAHNNDGNGNNSGHARVYQNQKNSWVQVGEDIDGEDEQNRLGSSVAINALGNIIIVGEYGFSNETGVIGSAKVFENNNVLSVKENSFHQVLNVYPNPAEETTRIFLGKMHNTIQVKVYNVLGKVIHQKTYNKTKEIDLKTINYSSGVYLVSLQADENKTSLKFIKK